MNFKDKLKYMEKNWEGIYSLACYESEGFVKCGTMSWDTYVRCCKKLIEILDKIEDTKNGHYKLDFNKWKGEE